MLRITLRINVYRALVLTGCLLASASLLAAIQVEPMKIKVTPRYAGQVTITSKSTDAEYIQGRAVEISHPGTAQEKEIPVRLGQQDSLVVTPVKFALPAGNSQTIRFINLDTPQQEKIYRVWFQSMTPEQWHRPETATTWATDLAVTLAWGVVVMVPPAQPVIAMHYQPATGELLNRGNVHIALQRIGLCHDKVCRWTQVKKNIYAGQAWKPTVPGLATFTRGTLSLEHLNEETGERATLNIAVN
ncbi:fimbrial protein [Enterobacter sp. ENT03]|uniref:fimbrial protein n=1 Tax=Enterobacter sp. ENT03 TaxID=2854780 RepID=UPI001C466F37|nr:fimbrial protein [Enterobacter sp. ENT03]MBV7405516.1 fimbrial protein [Enterobacter sp. ENT03]